ncbi:universal stress protein [Natronobeatus ordinarius]|uniref:universal stress protein n=1 Tax=Natronobeatus ordinarius TaxID=2963433 RepID=UPI0020CE063B|nr:universal stress protein [Natronobeatus ordinarius]
MYDTILVAIEDESARKTLEYAVGLADRIDAALHVLTVVDATGNPMKFGVAEVDDLNRAASTLREEAVTAIDDRDVELHAAVRRGRPDEEILAYADEIEAGLILVGRQGERDLPTAILGSTTDRLVRQSPVPVAVVPDANDVESE